MPTSSSTHRLRVPHQVADQLRSLHPGLKQKIKGALRDIQRDPMCGKPLRDELAGLRSYRVARFRIVYRLADPEIIEIVAVGPRKRIYEETYRLLRREMG